MYLIKVPNMVFRCGPDEDNFKNIVDQLAGQNRHFNAHYENMRSFLTVSAQNEEKVLTFVIFTPKS